MAGREGKEGRAVFRASLTIENREAIDCNGSIVGWIFCRLPVRSGRSQRRGDKYCHNNRSYLLHPCTSNISSTSTGVPSGRLETRYTRRVGFFSGPNTSSGKSNAPSATFGWSLTLRRHADPEANDSFHAIQRTEMLASESDGVHRAEPSCLPARRLLPPARRTWPYAPRSASFRSERQLPNTFRTAPAQLEGECLTP